MYDELIKSLRLCTSDKRGYGCAKDCVYGKKHPLNWWCMDYLFREAADTIEELITNYNAVTDIMKYQTEYIEELQAQLMYSNDVAWIPVTKRLPKEADGMVFVLMPDVFPYNSKQPFVNCNQDCRIEMAHYSEHSRTWYFGDCGAVGGQEPIAWIHRNALPDPPKEET